MCEKEGLTSARAVASRLTATLAALNAYLGDSKYFGGTRPNCVDAAAFAYLAVLFSIPYLKNKSLLRARLSQSRLIRYCADCERVKRIWNHDETFMIGVKSG